MRTTEMKALTPRKRDFDIVDHSIWSYDVKERGLLTMNDVTRC